MHAMLLEGTVRPLTGYLLCYIPLATVIIGLITLFVLTDRHASRPYLRYNPFVAAGSTDQELATRPPAVGETPAGPLSGAASAGETMVSLGEHGATVAVPKQAVPPPAAPDRAPALSGEPPADVPKDLGRVTGIDLPDVDQSPPALKQPPTNVAPPSAAEMAAPAAPALDAGVTKGIGITYIEFNPAGSDLEGEYVRIANSTDSAINMTGWTLRDAWGKHSFSFPAFMLAPGAVVQIWTKSGQNDTAHLYWGQPGAVWNNTGDTAILLDARGNEVARFSYQGK
jgi:hypothetical protein